MKGSDNDNDVFNNNNNNPDRMEDRELYKKLLQSPPRCVSRDPSQPMLDLFPSPRSQNCLKKLDRSVQRLSFTAQRSNLTTDDEEEFCNLVDGFHKAAEKLNSVLTARHQRDSDEEEYTVVPSNRKSVAPLRKMSYEDPLLSVQRDRKSIKGFDPAPRLESIREELPLVAIQPREAATATVHPLTRPAKELVSIEF